jgi:autotransporter-associated beta strand protein
VHAIGGGLTINGGTVQLAGMNGDQIYDAAGVTVNAGTFDLNGTSETIASLNGSGGTVTNTSTSTASTLTVGSSSIAGSGTGTYGGVVSDGSGGLSLVKAGTGTLTLDQPMTYSGGTAVNAGTLLAGNTTGSATGTGAVMVNSGGTLGGNGTISGAVTVASGGTLAPGAQSVSRLTLGSTLSLQSGSTLAITLGGTAAGSYDQIQAGGALTLAGTLNVHTVNGFTLAPGETFTIIDDTGLTPTLGAFSNALGPLYTDAAGDTFVIDYNAVADGILISHDVTLTVVPEPSIWALLGVGLAGGLILRGRTRRA